MKNLLEPENKTVLTSLLHHHVVAGKIPFKDLKDGEKLKSLGGKELSVTITGNEVHIDGSLIQSHDIKTTNGVMHTLDTVLAD